MTLVTHPSHPGDGKVRVRILAATVCDPHGIVEKDAELLVSFDEWHILRTNGKAELVVDAEPKKPATFEELLAEVEAAGYKGDTAKEIAQERLEGKYGEQSRFLKSDDEVELAVDAFVASIQGLTKAKLVAKAKEDLGLDLSESSTKDDLIAAIVAAVKSKSEESAG